jgi:hypothetical protein
LIQFWNDVERGILGEGSGAEIWAELKRRKFVEEE